MFTSSARGPAAPSRQWTTALLVATACCLSHKVVGVVRHQFTDPGFLGDRTTIVELFEWAWPDVAQECEDFLGPFGYGAVQVSPPSENAFLLYTTPGGVNVRSWYERYEPVSYRIASPSGDLQEFADMVRRCRESHVKYGRVFIADFFLETKDVIRQNSLNINDLKGEHTFYRRI